MGVTSSKCCCTITERQCMKHLSGDVCSRTLLVVGLIAYTALGAMIFQYVELPREKSDVARACSAVATSREKILQATAFRSGNNRHTDIRSLLVQHEEILRNASLLDIICSSLPYNYTYKWSYSHSMFFATTVLTTIGYGNMAPKTVLGRCFCMLFAMIGIPLTVTVISDTGSSLATACSTIYSRACPTLQGTSDGKSVEEQSGSQPQSGLHARTLTTLLPLALLLLYIALGGLLFLLWEKWSFLESFYFCFITMTTIGFGDLVPANASYMLVCTLYVFVGLSLTTTIIELVRRQYAKSWQQVRLLSARLQGLSGPLAQHLRKLGERGGSVEVDGDLLYELKQLKVLMNSNNLQHNFNLDDRELDALKSSTTVIQIIIYESNV